MRRCTPVATWARSSSVDSLRAANVPLRREPLAQGRPGLSAGAADQDGELVGAGERGRIAAGLACEADDLGPRPGVALRRLEVGQPAVTFGGHALEHRVHVAADDDGRARALRRPRAHDGFAQVELVGLERHPVLGPEPDEDLEVALEEPAPLPERHAHCVELAGVPAGGCALASRGSESGRCPSLADYVWGPTATWEATAAGKRVNVAYALLSPPPVFPGLAQRSVRGPPASPVAESPPAPGADAHAHPTGPARNSRARGRLPSRS